MGTLGMCTATLLADPMGASEADLRAAAEAAAHAGFSELSVWAFQRASLGPLSELGLRMTAVEAATAWASGDAAAAAAEAADLAAIAAEHGSTKIVAVTMEPTVPDRDRARDNLAVLVHAAEEVGAQVCVEFLPWSGIPDLATAWDLVEPLGPGAGLLLDTWHWQRQPGGPNPELLARIPGERIGYVQVCDAAPVSSDDSLTEAMSNRLLPGDGVVDFATLFEILGAIGATPFVATEIFNPALVVERGAEGAAKAMAAAATAVLPER